MLTDHFSKDVTGLILSLFSKDDRHYVNKNWDQIKYPCRYAAENGHLDVLQWAIKNGYKWNKRITHYIALCTYVQGF